MTDFRFSGGRKTNGPLIHALNTHFEIRFSPHKKPGQEYRIHLRLYFLLFFIIK